MLLSLRHLCEPRCDLVPERELLRFELADRSFGFRGHGSKIVLNVPTVNFFSA